MFGAELFERGKGFKGHDDAGLHVEDAGTEDLAVGFAPRHFGERSERPDGVQMAEEQDAAAFGAGGAETELEDVAVLFLAMAFYGRAEVCGPGGNESVGAIDCGFVLAGGFDFDQLAEA